MVGTFDFGSHEGEPVRGYVLTNRNGIEARLISYGARLTEFHLPGTDGKTADIVLGFDSLAGYVATNTYFGATCGRYGNRIKGGRFPLDGRTVQLDRNEGPNHLHGGAVGFDRRNWHSLADPGSNSVTFSLVSPAGDMGFPGRLLVSATYRLGDDDSLRITMNAITDEPTIVNLVHHTYWNLAGQGSGDVRDQHLRLAADHYTPIDAELITTGEVAAVAGTIFDFRSSKAIGQDIDKLGDIGTGDLVGGGYDHNWCLNGGNSGMHLCASVSDPASGRGFELLTNEPGVQFYTGGYLSPAVVGKRGKPYCRFAGYTFETQKFPNTPNFGHFPLTVLRPGQVYDHQMLFRFTNGR